MLWRVKMKIRTALAFIWLIYTCGWMTYQFIFGDVEPNLSVAITEAVICFGFICLGIERLLNLREG